MTPLAYQARWIFPVDRPPIPYGVITVGGGKILAVGQNESGRFPIELGNVALIPGLVNAHTHLEFSLLDQPLGRARMSFAGWIGEVVAWRRSLGDEQATAPGGVEAYRSRAVERGLAESRAAGVAAVGEIATSGWPVDVARSADQIHCTAFGELLGLSADRVTPLLAAAGQHVSLLRGEPEHLRAGLSPHAPYTVHPELLRRACELSRDERLPLAMHLAESREELELLASHSGLLVDFLEPLGAWHPDALPRGQTPLDYLQTLATAHRALVIHGNYLRPGETTFLAAHREQMSLVYCPRTHAYFGHEPYPLRELLTAGVRVAVGTDSRASNPDLSLLNELRHIAQYHPAIEPSEILRLGTIHGAEALGINRQLGTLSPGKNAAIAVVELADEANDPLETIFRTSHAPAIWPLDAVR